MGDVVKNGKGISIGGNESVVAPNRGGTVESHAKGVSVSATPVSVVAENRGGTVESHAKGVSIGMTGWVDDFGMIASKSAEAQAKK